jgi:hypothetical protein
MVDMTAITAVAASLNAAKEITKAMIGLRDAALIQGKVIELNSTILDAQSSAFAANDERSALIEQVRDLEKQLVDLKAWDTEKQRYHLKQIQTGVTVYALKEGMESGEPSHYLCTHCYGRAQKSVLQREMLSPGMTIIHVCHQCGAEFVEHGQRQPEHRKMPRRR